MNRLNAEIIDYYNLEVVRMIMEKYGYPELEAIKLFILSKTHELLEDADCGMTSFGAGAVLEIWEAEKITGDPRNSVYIRED